MKKLVAVDSGDQVVAVLTTRYILYFYIGRLLQHSFSMYIVSLLSRLDLECFHGVRCLVQGCSRQLDLQGDGR